MISKEDLRIARTMSGRYRGNKRFDADDAFQAAIEGLVRSGVPDNQGLRVLAMRNGIARQVTRCVFPMTIPRSSYDKMKKAGTLPDYTQNVQTSDYVFESLGEDRGYEASEDRVFVSQVLDGLDTHELRVVSMWMDGKRFPYKTREADKKLLQETLDKIREEHKDVS